MEKLTVKVEKDEFQLMMIGFVRYSLPRQSYIVSECVYLVKKHWADLTNNTKSVIKLDVCDYIERTQDCFGSDFDIKTFLQFDLNRWKELFQWMNTNQ